MDKFNLGPPVQKRWIGTSEAGTIVLKRSGLESISGMVKSFYKSGQDLTMDWNDRVSPSVPFRPR